MYCKNCGKQIDDNAYVCLGCGAIVEENREAVSPRYCGNCGSRVEKDASVCPNCGSRLAPPMTKPYGGGMATALAIVSMVLSVLTAKLMGAVLAIIGTILAVSRKDSKALTLNIIAMGVCAGVAFIVIVASL